MKRNVCILLVEDDPAVGDTTHHILVYLGHQPVLATSVIEAHGHLSKTHAFELLLLDLQLGNQRSEPLIHRLRQEGATIPPILVLSAQPFTDVEQAVRDIGAKGFVRKPTSVEDLNVGIHRALA